MARVKTPAEGGGAVRGRRSARPARKQGSNVVVAKSGSGNDGGTVEDPGKIALFATPVRVELVTAIQALGGAATVAQLAIQLGRPADGLYYHLRALVRGGLLRESGHPWPTQLDGGEQVCEVVAATVRERGHGPNHSRSLTNGLNAIDSPRARGKAVVH